MSDHELEILREAGALVEAEEAKWDTYWECPCGSDPPRPGATTTPVRTLISLREPQCTFCGRKYREEYQR